MSTTSDEPLGSAGPLQAGGPDGSDGTIVLLTEERVQREDAQRILALHEGEDLAYLVLVPADTHRSLLRDVADALSLARLRDALSALRHDEADEADARSGADAILEATVASLRAHGRRTDGRIVADDPLPSVREAVDAGAREIVVVTRPHALEETLHQDWASRARAQLGVPVLHVYGGTGFVR